MGTKIRTVILDGDESDRYISKKDLYIWLLESANSISKNDTIETAKTSDIILNIAQQIKQFGEK